MRGDGTVVVHTGKGPTPHEILSGNSGHEQTIFHLSARPRRGERRRLGLSAGTSLVRIENTRR